MCLRTVSKFPLMSLNCLRWLHTHTHTEIHIYIHTHTSFDTGTSLSLGDTEQRKHTFRLSLGGKRFAKIIFVPAINPFLALR